MCCRIWSYTMFVLCDDKVIMAFVSHSVIKSLQGKPLVPSILSLPPLSPPLRCAAIARCGSAICEGLFGFLSSSPPSSFFSLPPSGSSGRPPQCEAPEATRPETARIRCGVQQLKYKTFVNRLLDVTKESTGSMWLLMWNNWASILCRLQSCHLIQKCVCAIF